MPTGPIPRSRTVQLQPTRAAAPLVVALLFALLSTFLTPAASAASAASMVQPDPRYFTYTEKGTMYTSVTGVPTRSGVKRYEVVLSTGKVVKAITPGTIPTGGRPRPRGSGGVRHLRGGSRRSWGWRPGRHPRSDGHPAAARAN